LKSATDSCQTERQIKQDTQWGSARIARVSQQYLHENYPPMLEKEQWPPNNSANLNGMVTSCLGSDARSYFETFFSSPKQLLD